MLRFLAWEDAVNQKEFWKSTVLFFVQGNNDWGFEILTLHCRDNIYWGMFNRIFTFRSESISLKKTRQICIWEGIFGCYFMERKSRYYFPERNYYMNREQNLK